MEAPREHTRSPTPEHQRISCMQEKQSPDSPATYFSPPKLQQHLFCFALGGGAPPSGLLFDFRVFPPIQPSPSSAWLMRKRLDDLPKLPELSHHCAKTGQHSDSRTPPT